MFKEGDKVMIKYWDELPHRKKWFYPFFKDNSGKTGIIKNILNRDTVQVEIGRETFGVGTEAIKPVFQLPEELFQM